MFKVNPFWAKPFPNNCILGRLRGVYVDSRTKCDSFDSRSDKQEETGALTLILIKAIRSIRNAIRL
jgi:hypothetical protein